MEQMMKLLRINLVLSQRSRMVALLLFGCVNIATGGRKAKLSVSTLSYLCSHMTQCNLQDIILDGSRVHEHTRLLCKDIIYYLRASTQLQHQFRIPLLIYRVTRTIIIIIIIIIIIRVTGFIIITTTTTTIIIIIMK